MHIPRKRIAVLNNIFCHFDLIDILVSLEGSDHPPIWISGCTHYDFLLTTNPLNEMHSRTQEVVRLEMDSVSLTYFSSSNYFERRYNGSVHVFFIARIRRIRIRWPHLGQISHFKNCYLLILLLFLQRGKKSCINWIWQFYDWFYSFVCSWPFLHSHVRTAIDLNQLYTPWTIFLSYGSLSKERTTVSE